MKKNIQSASLIYNEAKKLENQKCYVEAAQEYATLMKIDPLHIDASNRLMIIYRKLKAYRKEITVINRAITAHERHIETSQREWIKAHKELADMTRSLAQTLGLLNSKGLPIYENELLEKWKRRRIIVLNKLQKK